MRHQEIDINTWATNATFKSKNEEVVTDCDMLNEQRYMHCPAEKLLGAYRNIQYTPAARTVLVKGMGASIKLGQIRAICDKCIHNKTR